MVRSLEAVEVMGLAKVYPSGVWGIRNVSFVAKRKSIATLLGPNGAGKTTTIKILSTLLRPTKGWAYVLGMDVARNSWDIRKRIALCPQDIRVDINWSPIEAVVGYLIARGWSFRDALAEARKWLEELDLWDIRYRPSAHLSGGQRKRIAVAMVLATKADVLFLDEPTSGLDVEGKYRVWKALRLTVREGSTILLTTHDMNEASMISDKVILISRGIVVAEGSVEELVSKVPYRYRIVAKNTKSIPRYIKNRVVELGDRVVIYAETRSEALSIVSELSAESISINEVGLEDAYTYLTSRVEEIRA